MLGSSDGDVKAIVRYAARPKLLALFVLFYVGNWLSHFLVVPTKHHVIMHPGHTNPELLGMVLFVAGPFSFLIQILGNVVMGISIIGIVRVLIEERDDLTDELVDTDGDEGGDAGEADADAEAA